MMKSPELFISEIKNKKYEELIKIRKQLNKDISYYENLCFHPKYESGVDYKVGPSPDVMYQTYLEYMSALCTYMNYRYNRQFIFDELDEYGNEIEEAE